MNSTGRHAITFVIEAHEDTAAADIDRLSDAEWDRLFTASEHTGRVRVPRLVSSRPHPHRVRIVVHTFDGIMWDNPPADA